MKKPKRKILVVHLPRDVDVAIKMLAKRAGTSRTNVINVLLASAMMAAEARVLHAQALWQAAHAAVPDTARRPRKR